MLESDLPQAAHIDRTYSNMDKLAANEPIGPELREQRHADTREFVERTTREGIQPPGANN